MILADDILSAVGGPLDQGGMLGSIARSLRVAERFVLSDDIASAGYELISSKPTSLLDAMPLCRAPYPVTWLEWSGAASDRAGYGLLPYTEKVATTPALFGRTTPIKLGCLIESDPADKGQRGSMTWVWMLPSHGISASGLSINFDYTGNVLDWGREKLKDSPFWRGLVEKLGERASAETVRSAMIHSLRWKKLASDSVQLDALGKLSDFEMIWFSRHATELINTLERELVPELMRAWIGDVCGEAPFVNAVFLMMNSKNACEHEANDLSRLNRARGKSGKPPLLGHRITRLALSKARQRAAEAAGMSRADMRAHLVRGHFKIRRTGVYWWSPFVRGHGAGIERQRYEVR